MVDPIVRENTMVQTVIVVTNLVNFFISPQVWVESDVWFALSDSRLQGHWHVLVWCARDYCVCVRSCLLHRERVEFQGSVVQHSRAPPENWCGVVLV